MSWYIKWPLECGDNRHPIGALNVPWSKDVLKIVHGDNYFTAREPRQEDVDAFIRYCHDGVNVW